MLHENNMNTTQAREADAAHAEVDALKTKLKTYADYDEVKRELEILKVRISFVCHSHRVDPMIVC
jgi:hypothetical protein